MGGQFRWLILRIEFGDDAQLLQPSHQGRRML